jgi:hypothetical protein
MAGLPANSSTGDETNLKAVRPANRTDSGIQDLIRRYHQAKTNAQDSIGALANWAVKGGHQGHVG